MIRDRDVMFNGNDWDRTDGFLNFIESNILNLKNKSC